MYIFLVYINKNIKNMCSSREKSFQLKKNFSAVAAALIIW